MLSIIPLIIILHFWWVVLTLAAVAAQFGFPASLWRQKSRGLLGSADQLTLVKLHHDLSVGVATPDQ